MRSGRRARARIIYPPSREAINTCSPLLPAQYGRWCSAIADPGPAQGRLSASNLAGTTKTIINRLRTPSFSVAGNGAHGKPACGDAVPSATLTRGSTAQLACRRHEFNTSHSSSAAGEMVDSLPSRYLIQAGISPARQGRSQSNMVCQELTAEFQGELPLKGFWSSLFEYLAEWTSSSAPRVTGSHYPRTRHQGRLNAAKCRADVLIDMAVPETSIDVIQQSTWMASAYMTSTSRRVVQKAYYRPFRSKAKAQDRCEGHLPCLAGTDHWGSTTMWTYTPLKPICQEGSGTLSNGSVRESIESQTGHAEAWKPALMVNPGYGSLYVLRSRPDKLPQRVELIRRMSIFGLDGQTPDGDRTHRSCEIYFDQGGQRCLTWARWSVIGSHLGAQLTKATWSVHLVR